MAYRKPAWLTGRLVLLGAVLLILAVPTAICQLIDTSKMPDAGLATSVGLLLSLYPLVLTVLALFAVLAIRLFLAILVSGEEDSSQPAPSRGELGLLLKLKRRGSLLRRSWLARKLAAKTSHYTPDLSAHVERRPPRHEKALERLLRLKQTGAWNPRYPEDG
jgi:hypothetical protein